MSRVLIILFLLSLGVFAQSSNPRTVIVFGDSITAGGALPKEQRDQLWVTQVQLRSAGALKLINEGRGGRPTNSLAELLARHTKADALVIALGMNDSRDITEKCIPQAVANVRAMIEKARAAHGAKLPVLLAGPTNINKAALGPTKPIANEREAKLRELGAAFEKLAAETKCEFVSLFGVVPDSSLLKDGVHPDGAGNEAIAKVLGEKLKALRW